VKVAAAEQTDFSEATPSIIAPQVSAESDVNSPVAGRNSQIAEKSELFSWSAESIASDKHPDQNEDAWFVHAPGNAAGVFDGLGAADRAHLASQRAAKEVEEALAHHRPQAGQETSLALKQILVETHQLLGRQNLATGGDFATTAAVGVIEQMGGKQYLSFASVGDSRISILRAAGQYELTALDDHLLRLLLLPPDRRPQWVGKLFADQGLDANTALPPAEIAKLGAALDQEVDPSGVSPLAKTLFAERAIVTQSLGAGSVAPHTGRIEVHTGDRILLASDGIHDNLTEKEIVTVLRTTALAEVAAALVVRAHEVAQAGTARSKADDLTAVVLEIN